MANEATAFSEEIARRQTEAVVCSRLLGNRLSERADILWHELHVAFGVNDALFLNRGSPDDAVVADWLDQDVADGGVGPHKYADALLEDVTGDEEFVQLALVNGLEGYVFKAFYHVEGHLVGSVARGCILIFVVRGQILNLARTKRVFHLLDHLGHIVRVLEVLLEVADLHVGALDLAHFVCVAKLVGAVHLELCFVPLTHLFLS